MLAAAPHPVTLGLEVDLRLSRLLPLLILLLVVSCARHRRAATLQQQVHRYAVAVDSHFSLSGGHASPSGGAVPEVLQALSPAQHRLDAVVRAEPSRGFRDDSLGTWLQVEQATSRVTHGGQTRVIDPAGLQGRSVELRTFPNGEILAIDLMEHAAGGDRQLDVFALVVFALSPHLPDLEPGVPTTADQQWAVRVARDRRGLESAGLAFTLVGKDTWNGQPAWHVRYRGPWATRAQERGADGRIELSGKGSGEGELWLHREGRHVLEHRFSWQRSLRWTAPASVAGDRLDLVQEQVFEGSLTWLP